MFDDMSYRWREGGRHYAISSTNFQIGDVIDFYIRAEVTDTSKRFTSFPTQGQHDWSMPNSDNIPEERDFFSVLVTDLAKVEALAKDLQTDPGWTVGTDQWEFGAPNLEDFGQQPGNDYPFDNDVYQAGFAPNCYFTSNTGSVQGPQWDLDTEAFDLSDSNPTIDYAVVSYALWFYARGATLDQDKFEVQLLDKNSTWRTIQTIDVDGGGTKLVRWIRQRIKVKNGTGQGEVEFGSAMKLRFRAIEDAATVEAVVDEVRVWGVFDQ